MLSSPCINMRIIHCIGWECHTVRITFVRAPTNPKFNFLTGPRIPPRKRICDSLKVIQSHVRERRTPKNFAPIVRYWENYFFFFVFHGRVRRKVEEISK